MYSCLTPIPNSRGLVVGEVYPGKDGQDMVNCAVWSEENPESRG